MLPSRALAAALAVTIFTLAACGDGTADTTQTPAPDVTTPTASATPSPTAAPATATATDAAAATTGPAGETDPPTPTEPPGTGVSILSPVDKDHALPADYVPPDLATIPDAYRAPGFGGQLRQEALDALIQMLDAAAAAGHDIRARSAYRSYSEQEATFNYWVDVLGYDEAVRVSAMPGHSEHQLGTTADLTSPGTGWDLLESFGSTEPGQWLASHAHEYGFALSYPQGAEDVTGYSYEPWHFRYIGPDDAAAWKAGGLTLNQYLLQP